MGMISIRTMTAARLNASQRYRIGVGRNRSSSGEVCSALNGPTDWTPRCVRTYVYSFYMWMH